jgi:hypothetical protein
MLKACVADPFITIIGDALRASKFATITVVYDSVENLSCETSFMATVETLSALGTLAGGVLIGSTCASAKSVVESQSFLFILAMQSFVTWVTCARTS